MVYEKACEQVYESVNCSELPGTAQNCSRGRTEPFPGGDRQVLVLVVIVALVGDMRSPKTVRSL